MVRDQDLLYIINHVFLPPKLPHRDDGEDGEDVALLLEYERAWELFQSHFPVDERSKWNGISKMLRNLREMRDPTTGTIKPEMVEAMLASISKKDALAFHIRGQNAALIIRRTDRDYSLESFELSPMNKSVASTKGRLRRWFPGPSMSLSEERMIDPSFRDALVQLITTLDVQTPQEAMPVALNAQSDTIEVQDTIHPKFVTEMFFGILRGLGKPRDVHRVEKRTRDEVLSNGTFTQWRRSSVWLLLRVALQTSLASADQEHTLYKSFMVFSMARILQHSLDASIHSDLIFAMNAKISRRLLKLDLGSDMPWIKNAHNVIEAAQQTLTARWAAIEQNPDPFQTQADWDPSKLSFDKDTQLSLENLGPYLTGAIPFRKVPQEKVLDFAPNCLPRIHQSSIVFPTLSTSESDIDIRTWLTDIELWIEDHLSAWLQASSHVANATTLLSVLIDEYISLARPMYANNPEAISLMLLSAMDLWVALDKCAIQHCSVLSQYNPEFPESIFDHLLLPKKAQMQRLSDVENYLQQRRFLITSSVFQGVSFASQFFEQSPRHQQLRRKIETDAKIDQNLKKAELRDKKQKYRELMHDSELRTCEFDTGMNRGRIETYHSPNCRKCQIRWQANRMEIGIYEWPLPSGEYAVKAAVFELDVPTAIADWRHATYLLLVDVLTVPAGLLHKSGDDKVYLMKDYRVLNSYAKSKSSRLQLASASKSFLAARYPSKLVSEATDDNICVANGLSYSLYDTKSKLWTKELLGEYDIHRICTLQLPPGAYQQLQPNLARTTHTTNEVLALQSTCPESISLHEFYSFASLRCGNRLQWRNIARELVSRVVDFSREETYLLICQTVWEVGKSGEDGLYRDTHVDLKEEDFGLSLLVVLHEALDAVEGSWQGVVAARTFVTLGVRLLSLSPFRRVQTECFIFLRRAREVSLLWMREARSFVDEAEDLDALADTSRVLGIALTCHETFDVDRNYASEIFSTASDIATFVECSITIHDHCPVVKDNLPEAIKSLLRRFERRSQVLERYFRHYALGNQQGIDDTLHQIWSGYRMGGIWSALPTLDERWLVMTTHGDEGYSRMSVQYNILDGSLLVDGLPLTRLPQEYQLHSTYRRIFGEKVLTVVPSSMVGMEFETRSGFSGQQIHFAMIDSELIIRTRNESQVYELIPLRYLETDFPDALVQEYTHWLDLATKSVEWRPMSRVWESSSDSWQMQIDTARNYKLLHGRISLVDVRSQTVAEIARILSPLETSTHIHVLHHQEEHELKIYLPRYKLDFILRRNGHQLESKQFRGMEVDTDQSIGTFTGLVSKLVLRSINGTSRIVVVAEGEVSFKPDGNHVRVMINTSATAHVRYHSYAIDDHLGRLVDNGSLSSRLLRIYLHAVTSNCQIDQLTGRTGTEEALECLASAATRSFVELAATDVKTLGLIAQITPRRLYYPENLRECQQVEWLELSPFSQHGRFQQLVKEILDQARLSSIFGEHLVQIPLSESRGPQHLLDRASIRDSSFQVHDYDAESHTTNHNAVYASRDQAKGGHRELYACHTARLVDNWSSNLGVHRQLLQEIESWSEPIRASAKQDPFPFGFDTKWLDTPNKFLPANLYAFHNSLSHSSREQEKYKLIILLSTLAYSEHAKQELIQTLLAFATVPELRNVQLLDDGILQLSDGYAPSRQRLVKVIEGFARPFDQCPESKLLKLPGETRLMAARRREDEYHIAKDKCISGLVEELMLRPPSRSRPKSSHVEMYSHVMVNEAVEALRPWLESWQRNARFQRQIGKIQSVLDRLPSKQNVPELFSFSPPARIYVPRRTHVRFTDLVAKTPPDFVLDFWDVFSTWISHSKETAADHTHLKILLERVTSRCRSRHDEQYAADLRLSYEALRGDITTTLAAPAGFVRVLEQHLEQAKHREQNLYNFICTHLRHGTQSASTNSQMLPRLSKMSILSHLANDKISTLPFTWRQLFVQYGASITVLQRAERLLAAIHNPAELLSESRNPGHRNWNPMDHPEWLLVEIENNIAIREEQSQVAREMISPSSGSNSVLQLSMGLGKSSVIVPIAAATLASTRQLLRVIVLKPLVMQMFNLLKQKLGGLLNRRIFYMPITRSLKLDQLHALQIHSMLEECMRTGGILLMQPEHILSFELMGFEKLLSGDLEVGTTLTNTQKWLDENSRDIIDESDEILSVKYELIYTMGLQQATEFSPDRWTISQGVLSVLAKCAHHVLRSYPEGLEVIDTDTGAFPRVRILQTNAGDGLIKTVAQQVCENGIPGVPVWRLPQSTRNDLFKYLVDPKRSLASTRSLHEFLSGSKSIEKALLLLKGLLGKGVLRFCLEQKRWRVQYGLHLSRTKLAVPYHAKDSPAPRAEFSHPDATIILTCLSYYYGGLTVDQMLAAFNALLESDHAKEEYAHWVQDATQLPPAYRQLTGVNVGNMRQFRKEIYPQLRFVVRIINFYMSNIVFPAEMKEFPQKLSSSGWDIAREKRRPTTGFSGTNDSRYHLPLSIAQRDLPEQLSTNAGVLGRVLRPENVVLDTSQASPTGILDATTLINIASSFNPPARVILDVGAQLLDLQNEDMAQKWLSSTPESSAQAVIFFDANNDICVLSRDGTKELLEVSPFLKQMDACLVYLDEVHTRGTDLKMPSDYRALVTLGPGLTKDRLVQACMRMRKLGEGQSVAFCSSTETQRKILDHSEKKAATKIEVSDVLEWCIANTCAHARKSIPLWATQGLRFQRRHVICSQPLIMENGVVSEHLVKHLPEQEAQSLEERYGNSPSQLEGQLLSGKRQKVFLQGREQQIAEIRAKCEEFDISSFNMANLYEEQERELSPENEREKQIDRPPLAVPRKHILHPDVQSLVTHGVLKRSSTAFRPAFETLRDTTADMYYDPAWPKDLLVTSDFVQTVQAVSKQFFDSYLRPVNWILSCKESSTSSLIIISPFEAQELLPLIRRFKRVTLHIYAPRLNLSMRKLEDLSFCAIPPVSGNWVLPSTIVRHLNIYAGQLYFSDFEEYVEVSRLLGLAYEASKEGEFRTQTENAFIKSPIEFVRKVLEIRRKGVGFRMAHLGMILNGELIGREAFK